MSLRFGLYLVEQGIITCDQFCGLVGIQQQLIPAPSKVALQRDLLTIRQVARVYEVMEQIRDRSFLKTAVHLKFLSHQQARMIEQLTQLLAPALADVLVECQVLNRPQTDRLLSQFENQQRTPLEPVRQLEEVQVAPQTVPQKQILAPKFKQRPVVVNRTEEFAY